ncbi:MAG: RNA polymerase sigma factor [Clostridia bacterium]|nr:RNA polymerase sigma factor [Clostridia bacterium]
MDKEKLERKIEAFAGGDKRAFGYIYDSTSKPAYFAILYIVKNKADAEDLLHDTYIKAINAISSYEHGTNFTAWLIRIGKNLALNFIERKKREISTDFDAEAWKYGTHETETPYIFDVAAKVLPEDEYEIVMLCQVTGYNRLEVAEFLNMAIGTVTWKNNEALKKLKRELEKEGRQ